MLQEFATEFALEQSASTARSRMRLAFSGGTADQYGCHDISNPSELLSSGTTHASKVGLRLLSTASSPSQHSPGGRPLIPGLRENGGGT
jgi:hypothetical protein